VALLGDGSLLLINDNDCEMSGGRRSARRGVAYISHARGSDAERDQFCEVIFGGDVRAALCILSFLHTALPHRLRCCIAATLLRRESTCDI
jgi:hypothetical protein